MHHMAFVNCGDGVKVGMTYLPSNHIIRAFWIPRALGRFISSRRWLQLEEGEDYVGEMVLHVQMFWRRSSVVALPPRYVVMVSGP